MAQKKQLIIHHDMRPNINPIEMESQFLSLDPSDYFKLLYNHIDLSKKQKMIDTLLFKKHMNKIAQMMSNYSQGLNIDNDYVYQITLENGVVTSNSFKRI